MAFFKQSKQQLEKKAYRKIVAEKKTLAARQSYSDEAVKVAAERARARARRPSFGEMIRERARGSIERKISGRRIAPVRKTRRKAIRRISPVRRRKTTYRKAPVRRRRATVKTTRRKAVRRTKPQQPRQAQTLDEAMYGGY